MGYKRRLSWGKWCTSDFGGVPVKNAATVQLLYYLQVQYYSTTTTKIILFYCCTTLVQYHGYDILLWILHVVLPLLQCTKEYNYQYYHSSTFFSIPFITFAFLFSPSLPVVTQIRGHIAGSFPPLTTTVRALRFYREKISALSFLADSRRTVLVHARRSQQLILFYCCK